MHYCACQNISGAPLSDTLKNGARRPLPSRAIRLLRAGLCRGGRPACASWPGSQGYHPPAIASDSGISERYLAQIEGGYGNPSLTVLKAVADALESPITELLPLDERHERLNRIVDLVNRLAPSEWPALEELIEIRIVQSAKSERGHRIALVGLRGAGKSTLGKILADRLGFPFVELNRLSSRNTAPTSRC